VGAHVRGEPAWPSPTPTGEQFGSECSTGIKVGVVHEVAAISRRPKRRFCCHGCVGAKLLCSVSTAILENDNKLSARSALEENDRGISFGFRTWDRSSALVQCMREKSVVLTGINLPEERDEAPLRGGWNNLKRPLCWQGCMVRFKFVAAPFRSEVTRRCRGRRSTEC